MRYADFSLRDASSLPTPALLYHKEAIEENLRRTLSIAGGARRLWPHVKSHKTRELIALSIRYGITRFKCATIAEAETAALAGAEDVLLAYPLVGPAILRLIRLSQAFPRTRFWAVGDDARALRELAREAERAELRIPVLLDINTGQDRTGVLPADAPALYETASAMRGLVLRGLHGYDGQIHQSDREERFRAAKECQTMLHALRQQIVDAGFCCDTLVIGGTPAFAYYAANGDDYVSPGTTFLFDAGYALAYPDLDFCVAAAVLTRVVSHPAKGMFTLDLGCKGIASDPPGSRGILLDTPHVFPRFQNEEHWTFQAEEGWEDAVPPIGAVLCVIPTHICPTSALYQSVHVVSGGEVVEEWPVIARDRRITY